MNYNNDNNDFNVFDGLTEEEKFNLSVRIDLDDIDNHVNRMWEFIIKPYLDDVNKCQILQGLDENGLEKFKKFMMENDPVIKQFF